MKRFLGIALALTVFCTQMPTAFAVGTSASSAILMDGVSGRVLYEQNANEPRLIASITKLMTALVAAESGHDLQEHVTVAPEWVGVEGSSVYLQAGEQVTLETLLYGLLLRSGNDAAMAVAGFCGGSVETFVENMNAKAQELGMTNSHFANPHGLNAEEHYSSAYDMALLARACLENETVAKIVSTKSITLGTRTFTNHNKLLWRYEGCVGLKTGFTEKAGRTLVSAAKRNGMTLICVTLNAPDDWRDHAALFDYGFERYETRTLAEAGRCFGALPVENSLIPVCPIVARETVSLCLEPGVEVSEEIRLDQRRLQAPLPDGTVVGEAIYLENGEEVGRTALVTGCAISRDSCSGQGWLNQIRQRFDDLAAG